MRFKNFILKIRGVGTFCRHNKIFNKFLKLESLLINFFINFKLNFEKFNQNFFWVGGFSVCQLYVTKGFLDVNLVSF
jgi:hypothetical protein